MRSEFEKLHEIKDLLIDIDFNVESNSYETNDFVLYGACGFINGAWYAYQEQHKKIDSLETIRKSILWHVEDSELSGINNDYDQGWYDCLKMLHKYVLEDESLIQTVDYRFSF